ncbi:M28 family peptidase [Dyella sp. LX-66]|uniref:M28 family peptidase n=1 Tax=unclassified Dyella TaxID=2634549 RepID=UPI001BE021EE|nr:MULTISPECIES: M28 family peptidase [unclassified Dyella]MBT2118691.1 M28 family peptidase [Dyella sp. LX-1]MBT2141040.1 M28 family peptidase [Dyella sp. LX-66]
MRRFLSIVAMSAMLAACQQHASSSRDGEIAANFSPGIMPEDLAVHFHALSAPALRDRSPGSAGERHTVDYLIAQFQRMGLQPGADGKWTQDVPYVRGTVVHPERMTLQIEGGAQPLSLAYGIDMVANSPAQRANAAIEHAPVVFAGYGIDDPAQDWDDYAGADIKGKAVVLLANDPGWGSQDPALFHGRTPTLFGSWRYKLEQAARHGAAAVFVVHDEAASGYPWTTVRQRWGGPWYTLPGDANAAPAIAGWLSDDAARRLFASAGQDFQALRAAAHRRGFHAVTLAAKASLAFQSSISQGMSPNVIARMNGSKQPDDAIVYTAHWNHPDARDSQSLHGVAESAAGLAGLLELAEAFAHRAPKPHRSVLFVALTMEESGQLGSRWYVDHPPVALEHTVAEIQLDALPWLGPSHDLDVLGYGQSQLDDYLADALQSQHRRMRSGDERAGMELFRSDALSFATRGVPVLYARSGLDLRDGGDAAGRKRYGDYLAASASAPPAGSAPNWDLRGLVEDLRALFMVGGKLSTETSYPQWKPTASFHRPVTVVAR